ncbi:MAG: RAMP superfamily CRISPR-associated protein [Abditibacteriales bacterium]|nr:RAMP superfamily CRISPR-associated protein [Abditibacteriales bacterium]MDW8365284.1 RAMP superfamily CRISPR-associated protein [Abditibacteriales bacterium]
MKLEIELEVLSAVCVGSTADAQGIGVDKATARDADGKLIIPGSTLKGRIRWECERIARALGWEVCDAPQTDNMCPYFWHHRGVSDDKYCIICETFGGSARHAALWFGDAALADDVRLRNTPVLQRGKSVSERRPFDAQIRPGVSISRARRAAFSERLFFTETSAPNARFRFRALIEGDPPSHKHRALLLAGVRALSLVGGGRSRGLGWVRVARGVLDGDELTDTRWKELLKPLEEVTT